MSSFLYYVIHRGHKTSHQQFIDFLLTEIKDFIFESDNAEENLHFESLGENPLRGQILLDCQENDLYKVLDVLFKLSKEFDELVFSIATENHEKNPFYKECLNNEVIPTWCVEPYQFTTNLYGCGGVLHLLTPEISQQFQTLTPEKIIRLYGSKTRNVLITEAVQRRIFLAISDNFGMHRVPVSIPESLAYIAKQRPDLLSFAIRDYFNKNCDNTFVNGTSHRKYGKCLMVHTWLCQRDYKTVTELASIDAPADIISHRITNALIELDMKSLTLQESSAYLDNDNGFEQERLDFLAKCLFGTRPAIQQAYVRAKSLIGPRQKAECRRLYVDGISTTADEDSEPDERMEKKSIMKKRRHLGKKVVLTPVMNSSSSGTTNMNNEKEELSINKPSSYLKSFERAVNGEEKYYRQSTDDDSLGEEEDLDFFTCRSKKKQFLKNNLQEPVVSRSNKNEALEDDFEDFSLSELIHPAPPLIESLTMEDFDDL